MFRSLYGTNIMRMPMEFGGIARPHGVPQNNATELSDIRGGTRETSIIPARVADLIAMGGGQSGFASRRRIFPAQNRLT